MGQLKRQLLIWGAIATTTAVLPGLALADNASPEQGGGRHGRGDHGRDHRDGDAKLAVAGRAISKGTTDSYGLEIRGHSADKPTDAGGMVRFAHKGDKAMEGLVGEITCLSKDSAGIVSVTGTITRSGKRDGKGDKKMPGLQSAAATDDGTALLDELAPWDADEAPEVAAADPTVPGVPTMPGLPGQDPNKDPNKDKDPNKKGPGEGHDHSKHRGELAGKDFAFTIDVPGKPQKFSKPTIGDKGTLAACSSGGDTVDVTRGQFRTREANADQAKGGDNYKDGDKDKGDRGDHRGLFGRRRHR